MGKTSAEKERNANTAPHIFTPGHEGAEGVGAKRPLGGSDRKGGSFRKTNLQWGGKKKKRRSEARESEKDDFTLGAPRGNTL